MLRDSLRDILHKAELSRNDKLLLVLASQIDTPQATAEVKQVAVACGLRAAQKWNVASILSEADKKNHAKKVIRVNEGWVLTAAGRDYLTSKGLLVTTTVTKTAATDLRQHLTTISDANTKLFWKRR